MPNEVLITDFYKPLVKQQEFHDSMCPYRLMVGGFGSGKTLALLMEAVITCLMVPGSNSLILRTTSPDIQKTVINKFLNPKIVPPWMYTQYNKNEKVAYFPNGSQLHFGYCAHEDDINQFLSTEYVFVGLEEAGEFNYRVFETLNGRLRTSTALKDINGNIVNTSIGLSTNPFGNGWSWIKQLFVNKKPLKGMGRYDPADFFYVHSTVKDNPYIYTPQYVQKLEQMQGTMRAYALEGDMNVVGGQMYPQFNTGQHENVHVMEAKDIRFQSWQSRWMGSDWDHSHWPVLWATKAQIPDLLAGGMRTVTVVYREQIFEPQDKEGRYVENGSLNAIDVADRIAKSCDYELDEKGRIKITERINRFLFSWERFKRNDGDTTIAQSLGNRLVKWGLPRPSESHHSRVDGWAYIGQLLDNDELIITTDCPMLISALPTLIRDTPDEPGDVKKIESVEDDLADTLRYLISSEMPGKGVPRYVKENQELDAIADPVARRMRSYEMWLKKQEVGRLNKDTRVMPWMRKK